MRITATKVGFKSVVALIHVSDVERSIDFYQRLGFELGNEPLRNSQGVATFAWLHRGQTSQIMLTLTGRPLNPGAQDVMFYLYVDDMPAYRQVLIERGVTVGEVTHPFWSPNGEVRIDDPDGWSWDGCCGSCIGSGRVFSELEARHLQHPCERTRRRRSCLPTSRPSENACPAQQPVAGSKESRMQ